MKLFELLPQLTCVNLLQSDVFLQLPTKTDLGPVLARRPVVGQDEVRVAAVQGRQLAKRVRHHLVRASHLKTNEKWSEWSQNGLKAKPDSCQRDGFVWCNSKCSSCKRGSHIDKTWFFFYFLPG